MIIIFFSFWFVRLDADGFAIRLVVLFLFCSFSSLFPSAFYILGGEGRGGEGRGGESRKRGGEEEGRGGRGERGGNPAGKLPSHLTRPRPLQKFSKNWKIAIFLE